MGWDQEPKKESGKVVTIVKAILNPEMKRASLDPATGDKRRKKPSNNAHW